MAKNYASGGGSSKHPDEYWYEKCGPRVRRALQDSVLPWSSQWAYKMTREHGADWVIAELRKADVAHMKKGVNIIRFSKNFPSSYVACKVAPLRANW